MTSGEAWLIAIVGGALAAVLGAGLLRLFSKKLSEKLWRALRWPASLRITTTKRQQALVAELETARRSLQRNAAFYSELCDALGIVMLSGDKQLIERASQLRGAREEALAHAQEQIAATQALASQQVAEAKRQGVELARAEREEGKAEGRAEAEAKVQAERAVPLLKPAWRIDALGTADAFILKNTQHSVYISNVSVDAPTGEFQFAGATQTRGKFDRTFEFYGQKTETGRRGGIDFTVTWQDQNGEWCTQVVRVEREPRRATVW